jgi:hypothetical protein
MEPTEKELAKMRRELITHFLKWDKETLVQLLVFTMTDDEVIHKAMIERKRNKMPNYAFKTN